MKYDKEKHHRRSIRLRGYDYSQAGAYFVTICTWNRECLLGEIVDSGIKLTSSGEIVQKEWFNIPNRFPNIQLDSFIVMPNHIHGIIIVGATLVVAQNNSVTLYNVIDENRAGTHRAGTSPAPTLGDIIGSFKSLCIYKCRNNGLNTGKLWQRNYYEHIIRNENELNRIREYIINNPMRWVDDENNPLNIKQNYKNKI